MVTRNPERFASGKLYPREGPVSSPDGRICPAWHCEGSIPPVTGLRDPVGFRRYRCPAAARNLEEFCFPRRAPWDSSDASDRWNSPTRCKKPRQRNVYTPALALETPRFPNTAARRTEAYTRITCFPEAVALANFSGANVATPANSRSRIRSC